MDAERRALVAVAVQFLVNGLVAGSYVPRLPELRDRIGVDLGTMGVLLAIGAAAGLIGSGVVDRVVSRFGTRRVVLVAALAQIAALPIIGIAPTAGVLVVGLVAVAIFDVLVDVGMNIQGSRLSARRATPVINRLHGLWSAGTVIGGLVAAQAAASGVSLEAHLAVVAILLAVAVLVFSPRLLPEGHPALAAPEAGASARAGRRLGLIFAALGAAAILPEVGTSDWIAFRGTEDLELAPGAAGLGFVAFAVGMVCGRLGGDSVQRALGAERMLRAACVLAALGLVVLATIPALVALVVGGALTGLGTAVLFPAIYDAAARASRGGAGALAAMTAGSRIAFLAVPLAIGGLAETTRLDVGGAIALVGLVGLAVVVLVRRQLPAGGAAPN